MARPLRIEFSGALYHITSRGNAREDIYRDNADRYTFLELLNEITNRYSWICHAYCLMSNHYHILIETCSPTLSKGMKRLNGNYSQRYNYHHRRVGHVFQGRFKAILVEKESYLLELARYIVLNPVRARMVHVAKEWPWSSYRATAGYTRPIDCLTTDWVLSGFDRNKKNACERYRLFVSQGLNQPSPWEELKNQVYLGSDQFVDDMLRRVDPDQSLQDIPKPQKLRPPKPLEYYQEKHENTSEAMAIAYLSGHYTLAQVGQQFSVSHSTVSRAVKFYEANVKCKA